MALKDVLEVTERLVDAFALRERPLALRIESVVVDPDTNATIPIERSGWTMRAFRVRHGDVPAIGLIVEDDSRGERLVFTGDAVMDDCIRRQITPATKVLIHDCGGGVKRNQGHAGARDVNELVRGSSIERVYLTHLPECLPSGIEEIVRIVSQSYGGEVFVPVDGGVVEW